MNAKKQEIFFNINIKFLRERKKVSQEALAGQIGITRAKLAALEGGQTKAPQPEDYVAFSDFFKISIDNLLKVDLRRLGELKLRQLEAGNDVYLSGRRVRILATTVSPENEDNIEVVPKKAKAGYLTGYGDPEYISQLPVFQLPQLPRDRKYRMFQTEGDSMCPIPEGAYIIAAYLEDWSRLKDQPCVVVTLNEGISFKMTTFREQSRSFLLRSLNTLYDPYEVPVDEVVEVWTFSYYLTDEFPGELMTLQQVSQELRALRQEIKNS